MPDNRDGPASTLFKPLSFKGNASLETLADHSASPEMVSASEHAPHGSCVGWGIPFQAGETVFISDQTVTVQIEPTSAHWFIFLHTADRQPLPRNPDGFISPMSGNGHLGEVFATYIILYADGSEARVEQRGRHQVGPFQRNWGEHCFQAVAFQKPFPMAAMYEQHQPTFWGLTQTRVAQPDLGQWTSWLWAWENPEPEKAVVGFRFEPGSNRVLISAISTGDTASYPLRWQPRTKACFETSSR